MKADNVHKDHRNRVRAKIAENGFEGFEPHEILEFLLFCGIPYKDTNELAHRVIDKYGSLLDVFHAPPKELAEHKFLMSEGDTRTVGVSAAALLAAVPNLVKLYHELEIKHTKPPLSDTEHSGKYCVSLFAGETRECFYALFLNGDHCLNGKAELMSRGTIDSATIYGREVAKMAIINDAKGVILTHNHPTGNLTASTEDIETTVAIAKKLDPLEIPVLDHVIVGGGKYMCFSNKGLMAMVHEKCRQN